MVNTLPMAFLASNGVALETSFPEALQSEFAFFRPANIDNQVMSRAEALCFSWEVLVPDKQRPFTGKGGPFLNTGTAAAPIWAYNAKRENSFYEFLSNDDCLRSSESSLPTYASYSGEAPLLYFDSRTYVVRRSSGALLYNSFESTTFVSAMPLLVSNPNLTLTARDPRVHISNFENANTFQVISAGMDSNFGFDPAPGNMLFTSRGEGVTVNFAGNPIYVAASGIKKFFLPSLQRRFADDNASNCFQE